MKKFKKMEMDITLEEIFSLTAEDYDKVSISSLDFSVRVYNGLMRSGITTVKLFLEMTPTQFMQLKNFGKTCLIEIKRVCEEKLRKNNFVEKKIVAKNNVVAILKAHSEEVACGDFSFIENIDLTDSTKEYIEKYKFAVQLLGKDITFDCINSPEKILPILEMFKKYYANFNRQSEIQELLEQIPSKRKLNKVKGYILAYTLNDIELQKWLFSFALSEETTLLDYTKNIDIESDIVYKRLYHFLSWCSFDLQSEITDILKKVYKNDNIKHVVYERSHHKTLEQIGTNLGVTRERVRQLESNAKKKFAKYQSLLNTIFKISAESNGDKVITSYQISQLIGDHANEFIFLLKDCDNSNYTYDKHLDAFIIGDDSLYERIINCVDSLPNVIRAEDLTKYLSEISDNNSIPTELLEKVFYDTYDITGKIFHRHRLSLAEIYESIIKKYYTNGISIYDENELNRFRKLIISEYGDVNLPENNRALSARIAERCILCNKGTYKAKQQTYLSKKLSDKIFKYIKYGENTIYMTNTIFAVFENELIAEGIDNKYYLQGVLHQIFGDKFVFRRDYISKDPNFTSVYSSIINYIKKFPYPVSKSQLKNHFPGITEIVFAIAIEDNDIINYFGEYLHSSHLNINANEHNYLHDVIIKFLSDNESHHIKDIYTVINSEHPEILTRNAALYPFSAYSILEFLFKEDFQFVRPYIANFGVDIGRPGERLHELVYSQDEVDISIISDFSKENRYNIQPSLLDYLNNCNDEFLIINSSTIRKIDTIGITEEMAKTIDKIVYEKISDTLPIYNFSGWNELPKINVPWSDWLLYSVLNKWGVLTEVATTTIQFKSAVCLVSPKGQMNKQKFENLVAEEQNFDGLIDDLSDMDALLENIMGDDFLDNFEV